MALLLAIIFPFGVAQFYNRQIPKGTIVMFGVMFGASICWPVAILLYALAVLDAYRMAFRLYQGRTIRPWQVL
ncbi:MAG TPA: hypothetical protein VG944_00775 [Fimbriimonas sp.]|nr:hypothetical protein [Fimbriimonas sp.]